MIRGIILFYLQIKPTHGYEIQRFLQLSGTERWAKIQSGSIYYALTKLEKEHNIEVLQEEKTGSRVRKIYQITEKGKQTLKEEMKMALGMPLMNVGSMKFITDPMLNVLQEEEMVPILNHHIEELEEQLGFWKHWEKAKTEGMGNTLNKISFKLAIDSLQAQIDWHKELLVHLSEYKQQSDVMAKTIKAFDFSQFEAEEKKDTKKQSIAFAEELKQMLMKDPENAVKNLDQIIEQLKHQG